MKWLGTADQYHRRSERWYKLFLSVQRVEVRIHRVASRLFRKYQKNREAWEEMVYVGLTDFGWTVTEIFPEEESQFSFWRVRDANSFVLHETEYFDDAIDWAWENLPR